MTDSKEYWREHREHSRKQPKPDDSYTMGEFYRDVRDARKERRAATFDQNSEKIKGLGIPFEVKNGGHHVIFDTVLGKVDFWSASEKYLIRSKNKRGSGLARLLTAINGEGRKP